MPALIASSLIILLFTWILRRYQQISSYWNTVLLEWQQSLNQLKTQHRELSALLSQWARYPLEQQAQARAELRDIEQQLAHLILQGHDVINNEQSMARLQLCEEQLRAGLDRYSQQICETAELWHDERLASKLAGLETAYHDQHQLGHLYNLAVERYNEELCSAGGQMTASLFAFRPARLFDTADEEL